jgi:hypothetical protein
VATSPLTGLPVGSTAIASRPVVSVVVSAPDGHSVLGVAAADIVYVEFDQPAHARLVSVYQTLDAPTVGPVAATAPVDPRLLTLFNAPAYGFDGGPTGFVVQAKAPSVTPRDASTFRSLYRSVPSGLFTSTAVLRASAPAGAAPLSGALTFVSPAAPAPSAGPALRRIVVSVPGHAAMAWTWNGSAWAGPDGSVVMNVVVQYVPYKSLTPHKSPTVASAQVVGGGPAAVYAGQHGITAVWSRQFNGVVTNYKAGVVPVGLQPGRTWVLLVPNGTKVTTS